MSGVIVHEWLAPTGGSENVFEALGNMFPDAQRFCLWNDSGGRFEGVGESWLARTPLKGHKAAALPLMPLAWRHLPAMDADWVLCSSHLFAHQAQFRGRARFAPKLVYTHTPARYVWVPELDGRGDSAIARAVSSALKPVDRRRAQEPISIAANSHFVAQRIEASWGRESTVIYPPVDTLFFSAETLPEVSGDEAEMLERLPDEYLLGVSRLVPYKRLDLVIAAGAAGKLPVVIAGAGPDRARLQSLAAGAGVDVRFVGKPSQAALKHLYRHALAVVFAPIEDFGIIPVEAMAAGAPVIANAVGGAAESVVDGETGILLEEWSAGNLAAAVERAAGMSKEASRRRAQDFAPDRFASEIQAWLTTSLEERDR